MDFGVKGNILTCLRERNCELTIYPYGTSAEDILAGKPDGIFLTRTAPEIRRKQQRP
ncbi:MAG: hypothetical protein V8R14_02210 [Clostridia bacterium]